MSCLLTENARESGCDVIRRLWVHLNSLGERSALNHGRSEKRTISAGALSLLLSSRLPQGVQVYPKAAGLEGVLVLCQYVYIVRRNGFNLFLDVTLNHCS